MRRKPSYSEKEKLALVKRYINGESSTKLAKQYNINGSNGD